MIIVVPKWMTCMIPFFQCQASLDFDFCDSNWQCVCSSKIISLYFMMPEKKKKIGLSIANAE